MSPSDVEYTTAAVLDLGRKIRLWAEQTRAEHPFSQPYSPDDGTLRNACKRMGATAAWNDINGRWADSRLRVQAEINADAVRQDIEAARIKRARAERENGRADLPLHERLRLVLVRSELIGDAKTASIDGDRVSGGVEHPSRLLRRQEPSLKEQVEAQALAFVRRLEERVDRASHRFLASDNAAPLEERLRNMAGLTPLQVQQRDPEQGSVEKIKARRVALGLDADLGYPVVERAA